MKLVWNFWREQLLVGVAELLVGVLKEHFIKDEMCTQLFVGAVEFFRLWKDIKKLESIVNCVSVGDWMRKEWSDWTNSSYKLSSFMLITKLGSFIDFDLLLTLLTTINLNSTNCSTEWFVSLRRFIILNLFTIFFWQNNLIQNIYFFKESFNMPIH